MSKRMRQNIILSLISVLLSLLLVELLIRWVDPLGVYRYYERYAILSRAEVPDDERAFVYRPGAYNFQAWTAHIDANGNRVVPHSDSIATCSLATIGDSVTFGLGVNDDQTWPDLIARELPGVAVINPSKPGYNAANFAPVIRATPATAYIYFAVGNDAEPPAYYITPGQAIALESALQDYLFYWMITSRPAKAADISHYVTDMGSMLQMDNLLIVAVDTDPFLEELRAARPDTVVIPAWTDRISVMDGHPNPAGHRQIAVEILPVLKAWLQGICGRESHE